MEVDMNSKKLQWLGLIALMMALAAITGCAGGALGAIQPTAKPDIPLVKSPHPLFDASRDR